MSKGTNYLVKFADFLDKNSCKKEADYIDKLLVFLNKESAEKQILLAKKAKFMQSLVKLADKCDVCNSNYCADGLDESMMMVHEMPESYMARPQLAKIHELSEELLMNISDGEPLEDWQESKIAQIVSMLSAVYDHIKYEKGGYPGQAPKAKKLMIG